MCSPAFRSFLKSLPKCEHHMHLEGALTPSILFKLATKNKVQLPADDEAFASPEALAKRYERFISLDDFLHYYYIGMSVLINASDFEELAWDYFVHAKADGVVHAEVFFDPQAHISRGISYDVVLSGFNAARERASDELDISNELICCFLRHLPPADSLSTFQLPSVQESLTSGNVIGIGLDSTEKEFPPELFECLYSNAKALNLRLTAHVGEEGPAEYIRTALDSLGVSRIDHGVRLADDPSLLTRIAHERKLLTVCPISNIFLRVAPAISSLPIREFLDAGVRFSINSDDPAYFGSNYILDNYVAVQEAFHLTVDEWSRICENAIIGSWCSDGRKEELLERLRGCLQRRACRSEEEVEQGGGGGGGAVRNAR